MYMTILHDELSQMIFT